MTLLSAMKISEDTGQPFSRPGSPTIELHPMGGWISSATGLSMCPSLYDAVKDDWEMRSVEMSYRSCLNKLDSRKDYFELEKDHEAKD